MDVYVLALKTTTINKAQGAWKWDRQSCLCAIYIYVWLFFLSVSGMVDGDDKKGGGDGSTSAVYNHARATISNILCVRVRVNRMYWIWNTHNSQFYTIVYCGRRNSRHRLVNFLKFSIKSIVKRNILLSNFHVYEKLVRANKCIAMFFSFPTKIYFRNWSDFAVILLYCEALIQNHTCCLQLLIEPYVANANQMK